MELGILGPLEVRENDETIEIRRGRPRTLLTALILRVGETVSSDSLVELLWGDDLPQNPANALQVQVSYLRRALEQSSAHPQPITTRPGGYALEVDASAIDATRFEALVREARAEMADRDQPDLTSALRALDQALGLWRGDALADVAGEAFGGEATRLNELRWEAIEIRNDALLALGRHQEIIGDLVQLAGEQPLRERLHEQLVLALYRAGRQADALRAYDTARATLVEELGIEPGTRLQELHAQVLAQAPELGVPVRPSGSPVPVSAVTRTRSVAVPVPVTETVGRNAEVQRLTELLGRQRLVTLTGPGGAGKTRLAIEVARQEEPAGVVYVDLGLLEDAALVAATVASALGVSAPPDEDIADIVAARVADRPTLVVLDTCEHVLEGASVLASRIVRTSSTSRVLATSRRPLGIAGEVAWPVPPLALAPPENASAQSISDVAAIALFAERAAAVRLDFAVTDANAADIAAICLALDGLPLAIELAAARADVLTPAAIRARLEDRFALLVDGSIDGAPRQQNLRAALDWSYGLLDEPQRDLFERLSVFPAGFDLDAVMAVAGRGADPLSTLAALVRQSVVMVVGDDRYRLLDSVRAYAAEKLENPDAVRRLHAAHYALVAETAAPHLRGHDQIEWLARMRADVPQFRGAITWASGNGEDELAARLAAALAWFWTVEGLLDEAVSMMARALAIEDAAPSTRSLIRSGYGLLVASLGRIADAEEAGRAAVELARACGDDAVLGDALNSLAVAQWALGDLRSAAATHDDALEHYEMAGDVWGIAVSRTLRTRTAIDGGEADADIRAEAAVAAARRCGDRHIVAIALDQQARLHLARRELTSALRLATECVELQEQLGYTEGIIASLHLLGRVQLAADDIDGAEHMHHRALSLAASMRHVAAVCEAMDELARIALLRGDSHDTLRYLHAVDAERLARGLARRAAEAEEVEAARLEACSAAETTGFDVNDAEPVMLDDLVREILATDS